MNSPSPPGPALGVGALARRLGVPAPTLRTWERRYGIGPGGRSPGGHRRYTESDVARVVLMSRLVRRGVPPSEAARAALAAEVGGPGTEGHGAAFAHGPGDGAGPAGAVAGAGELVRTALALDAPALAAAIGGSIAVQGVEATWETLLVPALTAIGERYAALGDCVDAEHLLSEQALAALGTVVTGAGAGPPVIARPVVLACAEEEQHSLPLHALAAALAVRGVATRVLGQRTPFAVLRRAITRVGPSVVFIWSQVPETADVAAVATLPSQRPAPRVILGGPGWDGAALPGRALRAASLGEALALITAATA